MDASPMYLDFDHPQWRLPQRVQQNLPKAKILITLRNPVDVFWSHLKFWTSMGPNPELFYDKIYPNVLAGIRGCKKKTGSVITGAYDQFISCMDKAQFMLGFLFQKALY